MQVVVVVQIVWMAVGFATFQLLGAFTVEAYLIVSYFGLVLATLVFAPAERSTQSWRGIKWLVRAGFLVLGYFVAMRALDVIHG